MSKCSEIQHPYIHAGAAQLERLMKTLLPDNLKLDDRSVAELVVFVSRFSEHVRYWGADNKPDGDFADFFNTDPTILVAVVAGLDLESFDRDFRVAELEYLRLEEEIKNLNRPATAAEEQDLRHALYAMLAEIKRVALEIRKICRQLPETHSIRIELLNLIRMQLSAPLKQLIAWDKEISQVNHLGDYQPFIGVNAETAPWDLSVDGYFCIQPEGDADPEKLRRLYLKFFHILALVRSRAVNEFNRLLFKRNDHKPHIALLLAFLHLFRYVQNELNALPARHLDFYYHDVLRLARRRLVPDHAYLVMELAANVADFECSKGLRFIDGKDASGRDRFYKLVEDSTANRAKLVEKKVSRFITAQLEQMDMNPAVEAKIQPTGHVQIKTPKEMGSQFVSFPAVVSKDGRGKIKFAAGEQAWHPFAIENQFVEYFQTQPEQFNNSIKKEDYLFGPGFAISSPQLLLGKSKTRRIKCEITIANPTNKVIEFSKNWFDYSFSTAEGMFPVQQNSVSVRRSEENAFEERNTATSDSRILPQRGSIQIDPHKDQKIHLLIVLDDKFPAIVAPAPRGDVFKSPYPVLRIAFAPAPSEKLDYEDFKMLEITGFNLKVESREVSDIILQNGSLVFDPGAEIPAFGIAPGAGSRLFVGCPEALSKNWDSITVTLDWITKPMKDETNLASIQLNGTDSDSITPNKDKGEAVRNPDGPAFQNVQIRTPQTAPAFVTLKLAEATINTDGNNRPIIPIVAANGVNFSYTTSVINVLQGEYEKFYHLLPLGGAVQIRRDHKILPALNTPALDLPLQIRQKAQTEKPAAAAKRLKYGQTRPPVRPPGNPSKAADATLFLGFETLEPGQNLSLLFKTVEGTGDPDAFPPEITWSYLRGDAWIRLPEHFILEDQTIGLQKTGIVKLHIPDDISNSGTFFKDADPNLQWLAVSADEDESQDVLVVALPKLEDIYTQAVEVEFDPEGNTLEHLEDGVPGGSITHLEYRNSAVQKIEQPFDSFGGRQPESPDNSAAYYRRVSERLRHRDRAVTPWDYEHLTLDAFPSVAVAKCIPHTKVKPDVAAAPGHVTLAVIPDIRKRGGLGLFTPISESGDLQKIADFLCSRNSFFVCRYGEGKSCGCGCSDEQESNRETPECGCGCDSAGNLHVVNPHYEPVRINLCVKFKPGGNEALLKRKLNLDLRRFLAPWAFDKGRPIAFGYAVRKSQLLLFLEKLDYVDAVLDLRYKHFSSLKAARENSGDIKWSVDEIITPGSPRSVLTSYLDYLNAENPNVTDHEIQVADDSKSCVCPSCTVAVIDAAFESGLPDADTLTKDTDDVKDKLTKVMMDILQDQYEQGFFAGSDPGKAFKNPEIKIVQQNDFWTIEAAIQIAAQRPGDFKQYVIEKKIFKPNL